MKCLLINICAALPLLAAASSPTLPDIAARLGGHDRVAADVRYEVYLPGSENPVVYNVLLQADAKADSLSPCAYLTRWQAPVGDEGFSAYFNGNYYSYDGSNRLLEYHADDDPVPFAPAGKPASGVQRADRFARLLPVFIADDLRAIASDTTYTYSVSAADNIITISGRQTIRGYDVKEFEYRLADNGATIVSSETVSSPGQMSEQIISISYSPAAPTTDAAELSEQKLVSMFPDAFEKYRRDNYSLESLRGAMLPEFAARTATGERYSHNRGDEFAAPTVIALLDYDVDATADVVNDLREAIASMPSACDLLLAFTGNDTDRIDELTGSARPGETVLVSARSLARDFGVADTPAIIFARRDGTVADIHVGRNNDLRDIVIQKATMAK